MQIDRAFPHLIPRSERVKDEMASVVMYLRVVLDAHSSLRPSGHSWIDIADDEVFAATELAKQLVTISSSRRHEVAQIHTSSS